MERDERRRADALDRYWDAAGRGQSPPRPAELDDVAAAVVAHLGAQTASPHLADAQQRVRRRIIAPGPVDATLAPTLPGAPPDRDHRPAPSPAIDRPAASRHRWGFAQVAAAALVVLALGLGAVALGTGWWRAEEKRTTIPAAVAPDVPVVEIAIPAEALPAGLAGAALDHNIIRTGTESTWTVFQNVHLRYVLTGTLTVRADAPIRVMRAGGTWEETAAGAAVDLGPGDAVLLLNVATVEFANPGPADVEMVGWILSTGTGSDGPIPPEWSNRDYDLSGAGGVLLPGKAGVLRLRRSVLEPGTSLPPPPVDVYRWVIGVPGTVDGSFVAPLINRHPDRRVDTFGRSPSIVYIATLDIPGAAGTPLAGGADP